MGLVAFKERRLNPRRQLSGLLPGRLQTKEAPRDLSVKPVDISRNGLGVLAAEEFADGTELVMHVGGKRIEMRVAWSQRDFGKQDLFRYGLVAVDQNLDLENIFASHGCFAS